MPLSKPNILIIMPDQMRGDSMSAAGHSVVRTPNIDRICVEGLRFSNAVTTCPLCMPARASFTNGLYSHNHFMWRNYGRMPARDETFFQILQEAGYLTAHVGKSHYYEQRGGHMRDEEDYMHARGLEYVHETTGPWATTTTRSYMTDEWESDGLYDKFKEDYAARRKNGPCSVWPSPLPVESFLDSYIGRKAENFINEYEDDRPFCLFVGFGGPHEPWDAPGEYAEMYSPANMPPAIDAVEPPEWVTELARERMLRGRVEGMTGEDVAKIRANYYGKISLIDYWVGRIFSACESKGIWDELMVVFWSDHGEMLGDHGRLHKNVFYESSVKVPMMIRLPGKVPAGEVSSAIVQQIDLFPTLLEAAGAGVSDRCRGVSLWPVLNGEKSSVRAAALCEHANGGLDERNYMVRTGGCKYAVDRSGGAYMLYDLEKDPDERVNLVGSPEYASLQAEMHELLVKTLFDQQPCLPPEK